MALIQALKLAAHLSVNRFGGAADLGIVLLFEQFELLLLGDDDTFFQSGEDLHTNGGFRRGR